MKGYSTESIRNIALVGHGGCGKTTFLEAALLKTGVISRLGKVEDGGTVSDYDKMEIEKGYSINLSVVPVEINKTKLNFIDTPGYFDFVGEVNSALRAAEAAVIIVDASAGIEVGTEKAWDSCLQYKMPTFFFVNKIDKENVDLDAVIEDIKNKFGHSVIAIKEPLDDELKETLNEFVAESDEELMEKYFNGEPFTEEEFNNGLMSGIKERGIIPLMSGSVTEGTGIKELLEALVTYVPSPKDANPVKGIDDSGKETERNFDSKEPASALVFKTIADPFVGKISLLKLMSGSLNQGDELYNPRAEKNEKMGSIFFMRGKNQEDTNSVSAGDIVAAAKLQHTKTGDTLCDKSAIIKYPDIDFPEPSLYMAIQPKAKGDEEKIGQGLSRLTEEDPSFVMVRNAETHQTLIGAQGEIQIGIVTAKLKDKYGVEVDSVDMRIPYRETIKGKSDVQGKHKKQTGGAGQYGDVHIRFSPSTEEFEFTEELFGGSVPKNYVPAVEKGLRECLEKGPLAGYPVVNVKAVLYDGSYHEVDSNEMAFKIAASLAFKKGITEAKPVLLEPVMHVEVTVPEDYMGDIMGDMNKRRGKILGMEPVHGGGQKVIAEVPQAEMFKYAIILRSMTQARGSFTMRFERYEEVPAHMAEKVIAEAQSEEE